MSSTAASPSINDDSTNFLSRVHGISRQSVVFSLGTLFTIGAGYLFKVYLARVLGAEALGVYALGMTAGGLISIVGAAGVPYTASRFVAVYAATGQNRKLGRLLSLGGLVLLTTMSLFGCLMVAAKQLIAFRIYHTPVLAQYMKFFAVIMVLGALTTFLGQALAGYKDVARRTVITNFIGTPATMLFSVALLTFGLGLWGYLAAQVASSCLVLVLLIRAVWNLTPEAARQPFSGPAAAREPLFEREVASFAASLIGIQVLEFVSSQGDRILLGIYLNAREVGIYSVAASIVAFVALFLQSINQIFGPTIAELHAKGEKDLLLRLYQTLTKWCLGLTIPLALGIMIFAKPMMGLFGPDFRKGWLVLAIATAGQLVNCGVGSVGLLLFMSDQEKLFFKVQAVTVPVMLLLNVALIPHWGIVGAAVASAATNASLNLLWLRGVRSRLSLSPSKKSYISLFLPAAFSAAVLVMLRMGLNSLPNILQLAIGIGGGYTAFGISAAVFALEPQDRLLAVSAYARIRAGIRRENPE